MKKLNIFLMLVLGFGIMIQTAQAQTITQAPTTSDPARFAIAPYAQVVQNDSYTFIGVSHPSLDTAHTSIGLVVEALDMTTVPDNAAGRATVFTVDAGETHRVFIVNQGHSTINLNNSSFTDARTHLITTTDSSHFGNVKVTGVHTAPTVKTDTTNRVGDYTDNAKGVSRFDNISQLSIWGVVFQESNGAGFALEFIGDMHDSSIGATTSGSGTKLKASTFETSGAGRGMN
ncbi:hypothetical protein UR09_01885 [Candidatus Nitromaritima sp. SCGC AAA799-A02]|nr:hypothetical protein UR09_01885 [Candidatus Nitromaritima sp. SCGC AAA799-A02]